MTRAFPLAALVLLLTLQGCAGPLAEVQALPQVPAQWHAAATQASQTATTALAQDWWRGLASPELDGLMDQALSQSPDLAAAVGRVRQAEAAARRAGAPLLPQLDGVLDGGRQSRLGSSAEVDGSQYAAGLAASYEIDLWGRLRADRDSALADVRASEFDRDTVRLTLTAAVVSTWLQGVGLLERVRIGALNLTNAERVLATVEARGQAGAATALELAQQRGLVAAQRRTFAQLRQQAADSQTALAQLLGQSVTQLSASSASLERLVAPDVDAGVPSALLTRRPDIARAEARLVGAAADIAAARAALLPRLSLSASVGGGGPHAADLFRDPLYSLAGALVAPIFDGGRLRAERDEVVARREELLADYRGALVQAFADVEMALNAVTGSAAQLQAQDEVLNQARLAFRQADLRYRAGAETLLTLLDAQRTLYTAQDETAQFQLTRLQASVTLARALGGGWQATP